jgi:hypothetical protein
MLIYDEATVSAHERSSSLTRLNAAAALLAGQAKAMHTLRHVQALDALFQEQQRYQQDAVYFLHQIKKLQSPEALCGTHAMQELPQLSEPHPMSLWQNPKPKQWEQKTKEASAPQGRGKQTVQHGSSILPAFEMPRGLLAASDGSREQALLALQVRGSL